MRNSTLSKVVFLGGNRFSEDGPLLEFASIRRKKNLEVFIISEKEHLNYPTKTYKSFRIAIEEMGFEYANIRTFNYRNLKPFISDESIIVSVNCHTILKSDVIDPMKGRIFNYHNSSLPEQRGAACHSWRIMQKINTSRLTFHHLTENVDEGEIIFEENIKYPKSARNLALTYAYMSKFEKKIFKKFLNFYDQRMTAAREISKETRRDFYWPRLNTEISGYVDWSWDISEIEAFCNAFDAPFGGASTFYGGKRVRLKDVEIDDKDIYFHPFQFGLIYRLRNNAVWIACRNGGLKVNNFVVENNIRLRVGKRFVTTEEQLILAKLGIKRKIR